MDFSEGSSSEILGRLSTAYGVETQKQLAEKLGISAANVSNWVQRNSVPGSAFVRCALDTGCNLAWLVTGKLANANVAQGQPYPSASNKSGESLIKAMLSSGGKAVIGRVMEAYGFKTQKELGDYLGISSGTISTWIRREYFPGDIVITCAIDTKVSLEWLATGCGKHEIKKEIQEETFVILKKYLIRSGELLLSGEWIADVTLIGTPNNSMLYIEKDKLGWIVDTEKKKISNGVWLININDTYDVYSVEIMPNSKVKIIGSVSEFECFTKDIEFIGVVVKTLY